MDLFSKSLKTLGCKVLKPSIEFKHTLLILGVA